MTVFVDASAFVAIIKKEPEAHSFIATISNHNTRIISGMVMWETVRAVSKASGGDVTEASRLCDDFRINFEIAFVPIGPAETVEAIEAHRRYGNGSGHPARLNMGDCFAYACARTHHARLLYKGDDFIHTDLG